MSGYVEGTDRSQVTLFPDRLQDWMGEDKPLRVIELRVNEIEGAEIRMQQIYRGVVPFVILQLIGLGLVLALPGLALWLPRQVIG